MAILGRRRLLESSRAQQIVLQRIVLGRVTYGRLTESMVPLDFKDGRVSTGSLMGVPAK